jgi:hypothetical protein
VNWGQERGAFYAEGVPGRKGRSGRTRMNEVAVSVGGQPDLSAPAAAAPSESGGRMQSVQSDSEIGSRIRIAMADGRCRIRPSKTDLRRESSHIRHRTMPSGPASTISHRYPNIRIGRRRRDPPRCIDRDRGTRFPLSCVAWSCRLVSSREGRVGSRSPKRSTGRWPRLLERTVSHRPERGRRMQGLRSAFVCVSSLVRC